MYEYIISGRTYKYKEKLKKLGLTFDDKSKSWKKESEQYTPAFEKKCMRFCRLRGLKFTLKDISQRRSRTYRQDFLSADKGAFGNGKYYFCSYCGKLLKKEDMVVDHIIPVQKAVENKSTRKLLEKYGIKDVNEIKNLAASCRICNSKKSNKVGIWPVIACVGAKTPLWKYMFYALCIVTPIALLIAGIMEGGLVCAISILGVLGMIAGYVVVWMRHRYDDYE